MTDFEYRESIESLVINGRGFQALVDLSNMLAKLSENQKTVLSECKWERNMIIKMCDNPNTTNGAKIKDIRSLLS